MPSVHPYPSTRDLPVEKPHTTLLFIDVQNFCARRDGTEFKHLSKEEFDRELGWFFDRFESETLPNMQKLQAGCRKVGIEVIKVTTGEIVSDRSPMKLLGLLYYGSNVWFRFEDARVEIFWRSVKSGQRVRRYSLIVGSSDHDGSTETMNTVGGGEEHGDKQGEQHTKGSLESVDTASSHLRIAMPAPIIEEEHPENTNEHDDFHQVSIV